MLRDFRLKQLLAVGAQPRERAGLVLLHEPAVTDHIGGQNCGEPALHAVALPGPETSPAPFGNPCSEECAHGPLRKWSRTRMTSAFGRIADDTAPLQIAGASGSA